MTYFVECSWQSLCKHGEELCGDKVEVVRLKDRAIAVLADGLGSGVKANILATLTTKIIATMLKEGARLDDVIETVGHTLPVCRRRKLAYSTFTVVQVMMTGETHIVEFDNPPVFYLRDGMLCPLHPKERTVAGRLIKESRLWMGEGDILMVVSDGVVHAGIGGVLNLGWQWSHVGDYIQKIASKAGSAEELTTGLREACERLYADVPGDDATIVSLRVRSPRCLTVAVGPPRDPQDDDKMATMLLAGAGERVVCGGTTSSILSRRIGRDVEVDLKDLDPVIPPTGKIPGIDLVTEGIITISHTLDYLKEYYGERRVPQGSNGATRLFWMLVKSDRIRFLVGRAINPAHQNPDLPINLALKMQVVEEIAELLRRGGKEVELVYF